MMKLKRILSLLLCLSILLLPLQGYAAGKRSTLTQVASGTVTQANMKLSGVDGGATASGGAFVDFTATTIVDSTPLVGPTSIAAGAALLDTTTANAFYGGAVDLTAYQTGNYLIKFRNTATGAIAKAWISATAPAGPTVGAFAKVATVSAAAGLLDYQYVSRIRYVGGGIVLAACVNNTGADTITILRSTDYGVTWVTGAVLNKPGAQQYLGVESLAVLDNGSIILGADYGSGHAVDFWKSSDQGTTWNLIYTDTANVKARCSVPLGSGKAIFGVMPNKLDIVKIINYGTVSADYTRASLTNNAGDLTISLAAIDANNVLLGSSETSYTPAEGHIWKSTDGGANWTDKGALATGGAVTYYPYIGDIFYSSAGNLFAGTSYSTAVGDGGIFKSTDGGTTWVLKYQPAGEYEVLKIAELAPSVLLAGTAANAKLFISYDEGENWAAFQTLTVTTGEDKILDIQRVGASLLVGTSGGVSGEAEIWRGSLTDPAATGALLLSTKGGSRGWLQKDTAFEANAAMTYEIYSANPLPLKIGNFIEITSVTNGTKISGWIKTAGSAKTVGAELVTDPGFAAVTKAAAKSVTGITKANPGVVTLAAGHGYANGDIIYFSGLTQMTELNTQYWQLRSNSGDTFQLATVYDTTSLNTSAYGAAETTGGNCAQKTTFTSWTQGAGWVVGVNGAGALSNVAVSTGGTVSISQLLNETAKALYETSWDLVSRTAGSTRGAFDGQFLQAVQTVPATYIRYITATLTSSSLGLVPAAFWGSIDNFSIKKVLTSSSTGVTITSLKGGGTSPLYNWTYKNTSFNWNDTAGYTYRIWKSTVAPVVDSDAVTNANATVNMNNGSASWVVAGIDDSAYLDGRHMIAIYDAAGVGAFGYYQSAGAGAVVNTKGGATQNWIYIGTGFSTAGDFTRKVIFVGD